ncbi:glycoside hydrolase family 18 protein [Annulohypoxylon truncatum]|uniref:glycoside hydrolase family 18 protein n=1 Tax=Annulohypoxylon truncatum TaxID=327061 RepID=UPI002008593A|nr:glycoside hydrolase family 18 protein [Annulohypoxylon truncatum]KAI1206571.1 glycoside hydrolase family 18 protein [Annulohypoxylon truncatum]
MSNPAPTFLNTVYYPSWRVYKGFPPSTLQLNCIDQVFYAFARLNVDGTLKYLDEYADLTKPVDGETGCLRALAKLKHQKPSLKTLISIGGGSGSAEFPAVAADPALRATFANSCRQFVDEFALDGVDIDWEHPETPEAGSNFILLLRALRSALPSPRYLLTTALPVGEYCLKNIDIGAAGQLLDTLNLMGYDFNGPWTDVCGHHAQLLRQPGDERAIHPGLRHSCHRGASFLLAHGFPARKLVLGVPAYARSFTGARGVGQPFSGAAELDYNELPPEWIRDAVVDENVAAASYVDSAPGGKGFVSFDVPRTVGMKAEYVKQMGLGGLFYWTGVGDVNGPDSLVRAGYEGLDRR